MYAMVADLITCEPEEVGHDFCGMHIKLLCTICNVLFLPSQQINPGYVGVYCSLEPFMSPMCLILQALLHNCCDHP